MTNPVNVSLFQLDKLRIMDYVLKEMSFFLLKIREVSTKNFIDQSRLMLKIRQENNTK